MVKTITHLGLIPDGTRRWSRENEKSYSEGYKIAMDLLYEIIGFCYSREIQIVSIFALSKENLQRSTSDLDAVFYAEEYFFQILLPKLIERWQCNVSVAGNLFLLPDHYSKALSQICEISAQYKDLNRKIHILAAYNPIDEINYAISQTTLGEDFRNCLWVKENVDIVIRSGYGQVISNFLPLQSGYAELRFIQKLFNDITINDIEKEITNFPASGERLLGK